MGARTLLQTKELLCKKLSFHTNLVLAQFSFQIQQSPQYYAGTEWEKNISVACGVVWLAGWVFVLSFVR